MSNYLDDALKAKAKLDSVSESMCLAKWKQVSLHLTTGHTNSCYHPPLHKIPTDDLIDNPSSLHNTPHKKERRKEMLDGVRCTECSYCWDIEDNGQLSDRHYRSGEPWALNDFNEIIENGADYDVTPTYVEVNFNNACNLKCSYCSPQFSSTWMTEINKFGAYPTTTPHNSPEYFTGERKPIPNKDANPWREAFWQWWPELYPSLKHFRMTGGEPIMDPNTYRVFDYVLENPKNDLHLNVTSNFSVEDKLFEKYFDYVKRITSTASIEHFMQFVSLDTVGKQAEYIRHGLDYDKCIRRAERFIKEIPTYSSVTFIITMNNLSIFGLKDLLAEILRLRKTYTESYQRIWFDTPLLTTPDWQSLQILPDQYYSYVENAIKFMQENLHEMHGFKDYEVLKLQRDLMWMFGSTPDLERKRADFYKFFTEHDSRRGTDFLETFPQLTEFWNECKSYG